MTESKNKSFINLLTTTSRNHYTLNQMVDRKARIILTINIIILSFVVGNVVSGEQLYDFKFAFSLVVSIFCLVSIIYSTLAILPEKISCKITVEELKNGIKNPLYFGNYLSLSEQDFENTMVEMSENLEFTKRSLLKDIYHIGVILEQKRKNLTNSLLVLAIGMVVSVLLSVAYRLFSFS